MLQDAVQTSKASIPERVRKIQMALYGKSVISEEMEAPQMTDFNQWHNGDGWPGDWNNGAHAPQFDQGPR